MEFLFGRRVQFDISRVCAAIPLTQETNQEEIDVRSSAAEATGSSSSQAPAPANNGERRPTRNKSGTRPQAPATVPATQDRAQPAAHDVYQVKKMLNNGDLMANISFN